MNEIQNLKDINIREVDVSTLVDIRNVQIDESMTYEQRIRDFVRQIKNPYCFLVGDVVVKLNFSANGPTITDSLERVLAKA